MVVEKRQEGWAKGERGGEGTTRGLERRNEGENSRQLWRWRGDVEDEALAMTTSGDGGGDAMAEEAQVVEPEAEKAELAG